MKKFKDMWEDAAANSVGAGGVSLPSDMMTKDKHKKHKEKIKYDARTKEGKAFVNRILQRREARKLKEQEKANKKNLDSIKTKG